MKTELKRGDIYFTNIPKTTGSSQWGTRPVVILQNNKGNLYSPTVIVAVITCVNKKPHLPTHVYIKREDVRFTDIHSFGTVEKSPKICYNIIKNKVM